MVDSRIVVSRLSDEHIKASPSIQKKSLEIGPMLVCTIPWRFFFFLAVLENPGSASLSSRPSILSG